MTYLLKEPLQEPLRKIQQFGDLLKSQYGQTNGEALDYLERMQSAAARMSVLIKDLLEYSRITTWRDTSAPVSLNRVIDEILSNLNLLRAETHARIDVDPLKMPSHIVLLFKSLLK